MQSVILTKIKRYKEMKLKKFLNGNCNYFNLQFYYEGFYFNIEVKRGHPVKKVFQ